MEEQAEPTQEPVDWMETRPAQPMDESHESHEDAEDAAGKLSKEMVRIKSLHSQWAETRISGPFLSAEKKKRMNETTRGDRIGQVMKGWGASTKKPKKKRRAASPMSMSSGKKGSSPNGAGKKRSRDAVGVGSPRFLSPLDSEEISRLSCSRGSAGSSDSRSEQPGPWKNYTMQRAKLGTPFQKQSMVIGPENPQALQSFLVHFMENDLGTFKKRVDLTQHANDSGSPISDATLQELADLHPHVEGLILRDCTEVTDVGLWALARKCTGLVEIDLSGCTKITHIGLRSLSLRCADLRKISLDNCPHANDMGLRVLAAGCQKLTHVSLVNCSSITDGGIAELATCCNLLESLNLKGCFKLCEFGDRSLVEIGQNCPMLQELDLTGCDNVKDGGLKAIARGCANLRMLRCSGCTQVTGGAARALGKGCNKLVSLALAECKRLTNNDVWTIAECLPSLESLSLRGVIKLKAQGIRGICEWCINLRSLDLSGCYQVDDDGLTLIGNALKKLEMLDLTGISSIGPSGVENLCNGCTRLIRLEMVSCKRINRAFLKKLVQQLPFVQCAVDRVALIPRPDAYDLIRETERMRVHHAAAVVIQKMVRGVRARGGAKLIRQFALRRFVVPKVQAYVRGYFVRKHFRAARLKEKQEKACRLLQRHYRGYKGREKVRVRKRIIALQKDRNLAATRIESVYRGWKGRQRVWAIKRALALKALQQCEQRNREEVMALRIQRIFRGRKGRLDYYLKLELKLQQEQRRFAEKMAAMKLQSIWRGQKAYQELLRRRAAKAQAELELASAIKIQRVFRGMLGRMKAAAARKTRQWKLEQSSALILQRAWRGCKGRHISAVMKSLTMLRARESVAVTKISSWWRAVQSRHLLDFLRLARMEQDRMKQAAIQIQRIFRGHKGREELDVLVELKKIEETIAPIRAKEKEYETARDEAKKQMDATISRLKHLKEAISDLELELEEVSKHQAPWYDSANVTGTLQRYRTPHLAQALRGKMEELRAELNKLHLKTVDELKTELRTNEKLLRDVRKELNSPALNVEFRVRQNRAANLRLKLKRRSEAAIQIQDAYWKYRVRLAVSLGAEHWQEMFDKNTGTKFYFNVKSQETTFDRPWGMRVLEANEVRKQHKNTNGIEKLRGVVAQAREADLWSEFFDETSGFPFYYNKKTGEYRWEMPLIYKQKVQAEKMDAKWLKDQNPSELTARSARMRDVASGWVEYQDPHSGEIYYFNSVTQETTWAKPDAFDREWVRAQNAEELTSRSSKVREASKWVEYVDEENHTYYFNSETGAAQWDKPDGFDDLWLGEHGQVVTSRSIHSRNLSDEWQELLDPTSGCTYYYNQVTGETAWSLPPAHLSSSQGDSQELGLEGIQLGEEPTWDDTERKEEASGFQDETGNTHYYFSEVDGDEYTQNDQTGHDSLIPNSSRSIALVTAAGSGGWQEMYDAESERVYYWNAHSGQTVWTLEEALSNQVTTFDTMDAGAYNPDEDLDDEALEELRNRDPTTFTTASRVLEIYEQQIMYDHALLEQIQGLTYYESEDPTICDDPMHQESMQWLAEYVMTGQLLSAGSVASHALARFQD